jgi:UDPglucose 6-dehydrogenase
MPSQDGKTRSGLENKLKVAVIGLGKLGLPLAAVLAEAGNEVFAYDANADLISQLESDTFFSSEPKLMEILSSFRSNIFFVDSIQDAVHKSELSFIIVPTPSMSDGNFDNRMVIKVLEEISDALKDKGEFHVIDVVSTVMPGSCNNEFIPLLELGSGKILNKDFGLCYNPEFIALGSVVNNMLEPDMHLIGASNTRSGETLERALKSVTGENVPSRIMNLKEAELVKISVNNFVTTKISFANMLMQIADRLGGIDIDVVTDAIGLDSRIGRKYLKGGTSFGGPCFPRDTRAMSRLLAKLDLNSAIPEATSSANEKHNDFLVEKVLKYVNLEKEVGLIGFSYKPDTSVHEESTAVKLVEIFTSKSKNVYVWEPVIDETRVTTFPHVIFVKNLKNLSECKVSVITRELTQIEIHTLVENLSSTLLLDPWRQLSSQQLNSLGSDILYLPIGKDS